MSELVIQQGYIKIPANIVGELQRGEKTILYLHGKGTSVERQAGPANKLHVVTGLTVVLPEYSGHGNNESAKYEDTTPALHIGEAITSYDWLSEQVGEENIIVYGTSYGAILSAAIMKYRSPRKVVLLAPTFLPETYLYTRLKEGQSLSPIVNAMSRQEVADIIFQATGGCETDLLVMKAEHDELVSPHVVEAWQDVYSNLQFTTLKGALHSIRQSSEGAQREWTKAMKGFIDDQH